MGGRSSSKNEAHTTAIDRRMVVDSGIGVSAEGDVSITTTDLGALDAAARTSEAAVYGSALVGSEAIRAGQSVAEKVSGMAFGSINDALGVVDRGVGRSVDLASDALGFSERSQRESLNLVGDVISGALSYSDRALQTSATAARQASELAARAYDDSMQTAAGNRTLATTGLIVGGVVLAVFLFQRR